MISIFSKLIYRVNAMLIKIPVAFFFLELDKPILEFTWEHI